MPYINIHGFPLDSLLVNHRPTDVPVQSVRYLDSGQGITYRNVELCAMVQFSLESILRKSSNATRNFN
jgi:hypothetical protein